MNQDTKQHMRLRAVVCGAVRYEVEHLLPKGKQDVEVVWFEKGLHATPHELRRRLQEEIDRTHADKFDALVIVYGLCGTGTSGLEAKEVPLVIPRGHDCITLLIGSKERYRWYFETHRGVYWYSPGWIDSGSGGPGRRSYEERFKEYERQYGREHAEFLMEKKEGWYRNYNWATYIDWDFPRAEADKAHTRRSAEELGWNFDVLKGDESLLLDLLNGEWEDERHLIVPPGYCTMSTYDDAILRAVPKEERDAFEEEEHGRTVSHGMVEQTGVGLGIDAGGTFTDAVIYDFPTGKVLSKAKSPTTRPDLTIGIRGAMDGLDPELLRRVHLVSLSTTLATNAIVEDRGRVCGLLLIGYDEHEGGRVAVTPKRVTPGRHDITGREVEPLDETALERALRELVEEGAESLAISSYLSVRNPDHEFRAREIASRVADLPVVCGHELTNELNAIRRAITAGLNGRLIPIIDGLIRSVKSEIVSRGIDAPLMIVKGDGTLMSEKLARTRPIETILSGPAASVSGARHLTDEPDAVIIDIGGTTTDIARLKDGIPVLRSKGTSVGIWSTSAAAVDITTFGLGGDSYIQIDRRDRVQVGPRRVLPLAYLSAMEEIVAEHLEELTTDESSYSIYVQPADFFILMRSPDGLPLSSEEREIVQLLSEGAHSRYRMSERLACSHPSLLHVDRLEAFGIIHRAALTPTDLLHAEGMFTRWDARAARMGLALYAKRLNLGQQEFAERVRREVTRQLVAKILFAETRIGLEDKSTPGAAILDNIMSEDEGRSVAFGVRLRRPIIGIGAPVGTMLPAAAELLGTRPVVPEHAEVANAVGAITGNVLVGVEILIRPSEGGAGYELYSPLERRHFSALHEARVYAREQALDLVETMARNAGTEHFDIEVSDKDQTSVLGGGYEGLVFLETRVRAVATGKPGLA